MSVIVELSIFPTDKGTSVSPYVARAVRVVENSGLPYEVNPMGTCIEGQWSEVLQVVDRCFKELARDCGRIYLTMKADYRENRNQGLQGKIESLKSNL